MLSLEEIFPPFALQISCGPLTMRVIRDEDIPAIVEVIQAGVIKKDCPSPFNIDWHLAPAAVLPLNTASFYWASRSAAKPDDFTWLFVVRDHGNVVGVQDVRAVKLVQTKGCSTGSWLGSSVQGNGIGTLMRQMIVTLMFDHLDVEHMYSAAFDFNAPSIGVSAKVGYRPNGSTRLPYGEGYCTQLNFVLTRSDFVRPAQPVICEGVAPVRTWLGLDNAAG